MLKKLWSLKLNIEICYKDQLITSVLRQLTSELIYAPVEQLDTVLASMEFVLLNGALLPGYTELKIDINVSPGAAVIHIVQRDSLARAADLSTNT